MNAQQLIDGLVFYLGLVVLLTFHEYGHAWMASRCGDDTARRRGRLSLNPIVHLDLVGTVAVPMLLIYLSATGSTLGRFLVGWAKPVPVDVNNFRHPRRDDILVSLAGPAMNVLLALVLLPLAKGALLMDLNYFGTTLAEMAWISLLLCFFNLLPIPPLDGSHVLRVVTGMSYETYGRIAQFGFIILIILLQVPLVLKLFVVPARTTFLLIKHLFGLD